MAQRTMRRLAVWLLDAVCVLVSFACALELRFGGHMSAPEQHSARVVVLLLLLLVAVLNIATRMNREFMRQGAAGELVRVLRYNAILIVGLSVLALALRVQPSPARLFVAYLFIINTAVMWVARTLAKAAARALFRDTRRGSSIVMVVAPEVRGEVKKRFHTGLTYSICGWLELEAGQLTGEIEGTQIACSPAELGDVLAEGGITELENFFICAPHESSATITAVVDAAERYGTNCHVAINLPDPSIQGAQLGYFGEVPVITYVGRGSEFYRRFVKRALDVVISAVALVVLLIPGAIIALVIALQSRAAPIYTQERLGRAGQHFKLYKFRSMVADADNVEKYFTPEQLEEWRRERKVEHDPRITRIGAVLRKTSLDELPQFYNVLKGDMSVVGPRPIVDEERVHYGKRLAELLSIRPGLTGWWQTVARNDATYEDGSRQRLELYYVRHISFVLDWNIFLRTFGAVFGGTGQ